MESCALFEMSGIQFFVDAYHMNTIDIMQCSDVYNLYVLFVVENAICIQHTWKWDKNAIMRIEVIEKNKFEKKEKWISISRSLIVIRWSSSISHYP